MNIKNPGHSNLSNFLPNLVISAETDPVGKGTVLLHLLAEDALGLESLVRRLFRTIKCINSQRA